MITTQVSNQNQVIALLKQLAGEKAFSQDTNDRLIEIKKMRVYPHTLYFKKDVSGLGGDKKMLDTQTKKLSGISSINEDRLPKNEVQVISSLGIGYVKTALAEMGKAKFGAAFIGEIENAVLKISQNSKTLLYRPVSDFTYAGTETNPSEKVIDLDYPLVLADDQSIDWRLEFADGFGVPQAVDANNHHLLQFKGYGFVTELA